MSRVGTRFLRPRVPSQNTVSKLSAGLQNASNCVMLPTASRYVRFSLSISSPLPTSGARFLAACTCLQVLDQLIGSNGASPAAVPPSVEQGAQVKRLLTS
jgi:hypothetical protein